MNHSMSPVTVRVRDLVVRVIIGTRPEERLSPQDILVNLAFSYDGTLATRTDALGHALDYAALHDRIVREASLTQFALLERLAAFILDIVMEDGRVLAANIVIDKPHVFQDVKSVAVELSATREGIVEKKESCRCY